MGAPIIWAGKNSKLLVPPINIASFRKISKSYSDFSDPSNSHALTLYSPSAKELVCSVLVKNSTAFSFSGVIPATIVWDNVANAFDNGTGGVTGTGTGGAWADGIDTAYASGSGITGDGYIEVTGFDTSSGGACAAQWNLGLGNAAYGFSNVLYGFLSGAESGARVRTYGTSQGYADITGGYSVSSSSYKLRIDRTGTTVTVKMDIGSGFVVVHTYSTPSSGTLYPTFFCSLPATPFSNGAVTGSGAGSPYCNISIGNSLTTSTRYVTSYNACRGVSASNYDRSVNETAFENMDSWMDIVATANGIAALNTLNAGAIDFWIETVPLL